MPVDPTPIAARQRKPGDLRHPVADRNQMHPTVSAPTQTNAGDLVERHVDHAAHLQPVAVRLTVFHHGRGSLQTSRRTYNQKSYARSGRRCDHRWPADRDFFAVHSRGLADVSYLEIVDPSGNAYEAILAPDVAVVSSLGSTLSGRSISAFDRKRVQRLMRVMGIEALAPTPQNAAWRVQSSSARLAAPEGVRNKFGLLWAVVRLRLVVGRRKAFDLRRLTSQPRNIAVCRFRLRGRQFSGNVVALLTSRAALLPRAAQGAFCE